MINWLANPNRFSKLTGNLQLPLIILSTTMILLGLYYGLFDSPQDYQQGDAVRIMYVHVPSAWLASFLFFSLAISCIFYLVWKHPLADLISNAIAPIGAIVSVLTLVTGSLWGKPMWGTWWVWDARLTSELILLFIYLSIIFLYYSFDDYKKGAKAANILAIVGFINIPIIHFSVEWWNTLHQGPSVMKFSTPSIASEMLYPLIYTTIGFTSYLLAAVLSSSRNELMEREKSTKWIKSI